MKTNALPHYDNSVNTTGFCAKFNTAGWDGVKLQFDEKRFARATTKSLAHTPINMGSVFERVLKNMETAGAFDAYNYIVLSWDLSPWKAEHLFAIATPLPQEEAVTLTGNFVTKVLKGPIATLRNGTTKFNDCHPWQMAKKPKPISFTRPAQSARKPTAKTTSLGLLGHHETMPYYGC